MRKGMTSKFAVSNNRRIWRAFTLVELLVVVAIIGILAVVVVISYSGAKSKANDARVQSDLAQVSAIAGSYATSSSNYYQDLNCSPTTGSTCESFSGDTNPDKQSIARISADIKSVVGTGLTITARNKSYVASANLFSNPLLFVTASSVVGGPELLQNTGFETTGAPHFLGWASYGEGSNGLGTVADSTANPHSGGHCAAVTVFASKDGCDVRQGDFSIVGGTSYAYSFWARSDQMQRVQVEFYQFGGSFSPADFEIFHSIGKSWTFVSGVATFNSLATSTNIYFWGTPSPLLSSDATVYFDDVSLKAM